MLFEIVLNKLQVFEDEKYVLFSKNKHSQTQKLIFCLPILCEVRNETDVLAKGDFQFISIYKHPLPCSDKI